MVGNLNFKLIAMLKVMPIFRAVEVFANCPLLQGKHFVVTLGYLG